MTSILLTNSLYCLLSLNNFLKQTCLIDEAQWQELRTVSSQQGTNASSPTTHKDANLGNNMSLEANLSPVDPQDDCSPIHTLIAACEKFWNRGPCSGMPEFPVPQKLWDDKCVLFEAAKFWGNLLQSKYLITNMLGIKNLVCYLAPWSLNTNVYFLFFPLVFTLLIKTPSGHLASWSWFLH